MSMAAPAGANVIPIGARARIQREGLGYRVRYDEAGVELAVDRLRESRGELSGELSVTGRRTGAGVAELPLYHGRFNLSSLTARKTAAAYLAQRGEDVDWIEILEQFTVAVLAEERRGEPFERVGRESVRETIEYRLDPLCPLDDPAWLYAPFAAGKTTLASAVGLAVAGGMPIIPGWHARQSPVLILDWEAKRSAWNDRIARIAQGADVTVPDTIHYRRCSRSLPDQVSEVAAFVAKHEIGLLIIDSAGKAIPNAREGVDANEGALALTRALRAIGTSSLIIDHVRGDMLQSEHAVARPYGSVYKLNEARSAWELRREDSPLPNRVELALLHTKFNDGPKHAPIGLTVEYDGDTGPISFHRADIEAPELLRVLSQSEQMHRILMGGPMSEAKIADRLSEAAGHTVKTSTVRTILSRDKGRRFVRLPDGSIALAVRDA